MKNFDIFQCKKDMFILHQNWTLPLPSKEKRKSKPGELSCNQNVTSSSYITWEAIKH